MLLTPRIIRTHDLRASDLAPIYIGTQGNLGLSGPPPVIGGATDAVAAPTDGGGGRQRHRAPQAIRARSRRSSPCCPPGPPRRPTVPAGSSPDSWHDASTTGPASARAEHGRVHAGATTPPPASRAAPVPRRAAPPPPAPPAPSAPIPGAARVTLSPPGEMRVGGGPYLVPISVSGATRLSTITIAITYNPALVARAQRAGRHVHAAGRRQRPVHTAGGRDQWTHRHCHHPPRRPDRSVDHRPSCRLAARADHNGNRRAVDERFGIRCPAARARRYSSCRRQSPCADGAGLHVRRVAWSSRPSCSFWPLRFSRSPRSRCSVRGKQNCTAYCAKCGSRSTNSRTRPMRDRFRRPS